MNLTDLTFPVLRLNELHVVKFDSRGELRKTSQRFFDLGRFAKDAHIIDSLCDKYQVEKVIKVGKSRDIIDRLPWPFHPPSPRVIVEYQLGIPSRIRFDEAKREVMDLVIRKKWYRQGGETEKEFRDAFEKFETMSELMNNISLYGTTYVG